MRSKREKRLFAAPADVAAEQRILAVLLTDPRSLAQCGQRLSPEYFFDPTYRELYNQLGELLLKTPFRGAEDLRQAIRAQFQESGAGAFKNLISLLEGGVHPAGLANDIRTIVAKYRLRRVFRLTDELNRQKSERTSATNPLHTLEQLHGAVLELCIDDDGPPAAKERTMEALDRLEIRYETRSEGGSQRGKLSTGIPTLNRVADGGLNKGDLMVIAGERGVGKTALLVALTRFIIIESRLPVAFFSLSLGAHAIMDRLLCAEAKQDLTRCTAGNLRKEDFAPLIEAAGRIADGQLFVDDESALSLIGLCFRVYRLKQRHNIAAVLIDGVEKLTISDEASDPWVNVSSKLAKLKCLAERAGVPVIVCCDLPALARPAARRRAGATESPYQVLLRSRADVFALISRPKPTQRAIERLELLLAFARRGYVGRLALDFDAGSGAVTVSDHSLSPPPA